MKRRLLFLLLLFTFSSTRVVTERAGRAKAWWLCAVCPCQVVVLVSHIGGVAGVTVQRQGSAAGLSVLLMNTAATVPLGF